MSRGVGYIFIEGDHLSNLDTIFSVFGYQKVDRSIPVGDFSIATTTTFYYPAEVKFGIGTYRGWTIIYDPDKNIVRSDYDLDKQCYRYDKWQYLSSVLKSRIVDYWTYDTASISTIHYFNDGQLVRGIDILDCEIIRENAGVPLQIESQFNERDFWHDKILKILKAITGFDEDDLYNANNFIVNVYDRPVTVVCGVVIDETTKKQVLYPSVKLFTKNVQKDVSDSRPLYNGCFVFELQDDLDISKTTDEYRITAEKDGKTGYVLVSKEDWINFLKIYIK